MYSKYALTKPMSSERSSVQRTCMLDSKVLSLTITEFQSVRDRRTERWTGKPILMCTCRYALQFTQIQETIHQSDFINVSIPSINIPSQRRHVVLRSKGIAILVKKVNICVPSNIHETDVNKVVNFVTNHLCIQRKVTLSGWDKKKPTRSYKSQTSPVSATRQ